MNKLEIACVIVGFICILFDTTTEVKCSTKGLLIHNIFEIIRLLIYSMLIILPLYFNYWRR